MEKGKKLTVSQFRKMKENGEKIVMVTAYDACFSALAEAAGADMILVGDSVGMTQLGYENTVQVTMDQMVHHCAAVRRGAPNTFVVGDMPFLSCQISEEQAMRNAMRFMQEGFCDAVKIESDTLLAPLIAKMVHAGIPVIGHIGLLPQHVKTAGGYRVQGKSDAAAERLLGDARALEESGVFSMVIECVPSLLAKRITESVSVPTIGIGAGPDCSGQVQVINDLLGLSPFTPKHAKKHAELADIITKALSLYVQEVKQGVFPGKENSF